MFNRFFVWNSEVDSTGAVTMGTDWYPEQWLQSRWEEDLRIVKRANLKVARIAEFANRTQYNLLIGRSRARPTAEVYFRVSYEASIRSLFSCVCASMTALAECDQICFVIVP
jgi:hypothetical protein